MTTFDRDRQFRSLSVRDLLEARDAYHRHLASMENVVGTAIGLYRIRRSDPEARDPQSKKARGAGGPRTLSNTIVTRWSWPCVLVFVNRWIPYEDLRKKPDEVVPARLHMPDGRIVLTCVVEAPRRERVSGSIRHMSFPSGALGGGFPALTDVQGQEHIGSLGCLVSNGDIVYVLTNRHVVGEPGRAVATLVHGERREIGVADKNQFGKVPFKQLYPRFPGTNAFANVDVGLVKLDDVRGWTAQIFGVGELGEPIDLNETTVNLGLIGCPVRGFGAGSGAMSGQIMGLFYRYRSIGGAEYIADLLIGPRLDGPAAMTHPGDSGTVWCFDPPADVVADTSDRAELLDAPAPVDTRRDGSATPRLRPIAVQWGGSVTADGAGGASVHVALATSLSQICRLLDVEVVRDWGIGLSEYWGKVGHYKVGAKACEVVTNPKLRKLMLANQDRIGVSDADIENGVLPMNNQTEFVALADVPDLVWRAKRKKDAANHFADMDQEGKGAFKGKTLMELWKSSPANRTPSKWTAFYDSIGVAEDKHRGALPFRVAELYDAMVDFVRKRQIPAFICTAGVLAHYVGDACQPLHVSFLHHGRPGHADEEDVHAIYETKMLDRYRAEVTVGVNKLLKGNKKLPSMTGGADAAHEVVKLMDKTIKLLEPMEVIDAYNAEEGRARTEHMWTTLGPRTLKTLANGAVTLAALWQSAWVEGGGSGVPASKLGPVTKASLRKLYLDRSFLEVRWLRDM